jgi:DNA invertase Pin-like site-specific DNA recombinase
MLRLAERSVQARRLRARYPAPAQRATHARAVATAAGKRIGRPLTHPAEKIEYARLMRARCESLSPIVTKTGIPKASLHRYLTPAQTTATTPRASSTGCWWQRHRPI